MNTIGFEDLTRQRMMNASMLLNEINQWLESKYKDEDLEKRKVQLKALCRKLPSMIHDSGLVITLFYLSKRKEDNVESEKDKVVSVKHKLADGIICWLQMYMSVWKDDEKDDLLRYLAVGCSVEELLSLTKEATAYTYWLKRSAENFL